MIDLSATWDNLKIPTFVSPFGRDGMGNRCHFHSVDGNVGIGLPSDSSLAKSVGKDKKGASRDDSGSSVLSKESLILLEL